MSGPGPRVDVRATEDLLAAIGLTLLTLLVRVAGLGPDGFHPDDAWIATAIGHAGNVRELIDLGFSHPGYNMLVRLIVGNDVASLADYQAVAFIAGLASVPVLYALVVRTSGSRLVAMGVGLLIALSPLHFRFSAAVKPYTIELLVACLALLFVASPREWRRRSIVIWLVLFLPIVSLGIHNAIISVAVVCGLVWSRSLNLRKAAALLIGQAILLGPWVLFVQGNYDADRLTEWWLGGEDGFVDRGLTTPTDTLVHLRRAVRTVVDAPSILAWALTALVVIGGLIAIRRREPVTSVALFCLLFAAGGGITHTVPFGPLYLNSTRLDMWLTPAIIVLAISGPARLLRGRGPEPHADAASTSTRIPMVAALAALLLAGVAYTFVRPPDPYPSRNANTQLAAARSVVDARQPKSILIGRNAAPLLIANQFPDLIDDVANDPTSPRGIVVKLKPGVYRSVITALKNPDGLDKFDTIVTLKLDLRWGDAQTDQLDAELAARGFVREISPSWQLIEVWSKGGTSN